MIRFHYLTQDVYLVSTRRKQRGYIVYTSKLVRETRIVSHFEAYSDWKRKYGWRAVGFNGHVGDIFTERRRAVDDLVGNHRFNGEEGSGLFNALHIRDLAKASL